MFNFHKNHRSLVIVSLLVFMGLSILIAIVPAYQMQETQPLASMQALTSQEISGLKIYTSENCMACHTQQVRNIEMDNVWGERPSLASDYYYSKMRLDLWRQSPSLLGSERTGPDLTSIGKRQPGPEWHFLHLYNPRIVVVESIMPGYPWLFEEKNENEIHDNEVTIPVPKKFLKNKNKKIVATQKAIDLVIYLQSLKQASLTQENPEPFFIPSIKKKEATNTSANSSLPDGARLYMSTCAACHQADGKGLAGAFPPLAGSKIVTDENPELLIKIILQGYDARSEYGLMPGFAEQLSDEEIAAIVNHERSSWGNKAEAVKSEDVKEIRDYINTLNQ
ncbi:MAG: cytochrome c [Cyclobacteriaceae bacterium]|nr:cytochrome c [Cyclobacteriaceae bacterium]